MSTLKQKQKKITKLVGAMKLTSNYNDDNQFSFDFDVNEDGDMTIRLDYYDMILINYDGDDIPMSVNMFHKLLRLFKSIKPLPDSGGECKNHLFENNYQIELDSDDEHMIVFFDNEIREFRLEYNLDDDFGSEFYCEASFFIEDSNSLLEIFKEFIEYNIETEVTI